MDLRDEFRSGWEASAERGSARDELHQLGTWLLGRPRALLRFLAHHGRALLRALVGLLRDALRGSPVLLGLIIRGLAWSIQAGWRASASAKETTPAPAAKPTAPAGEGGAAGPAVEEAQLAADAPAGPPWKRRKKPAPAPAKQATETAPTEAPAPSGLGLADVAERAGIAFLVLALVATLLRSVGGYLGDLLGPYTRGIVFGLVAAWLLAAAMVAPRDEEDDVDEVEGEDEEDPTENDHETVGEQPEETDPWPALRNLIRKCVEEEVAAGAGGFLDAKGRGARLDDLLVLLQRRGVTEAVDRKALIALLDRAGIPHREQIKFRLDGKQKPAPGVHVDDLNKSLGYRPRLPAHLVPDNTPQPGPSREATGTPG